MDNFFPVLFKILLASVVLFGLLFSVLVLFNVFKPFLSRKEIINFVISKLGFKNSLQNELQTIIQHDTYLGHQHRDVGIITYKEEFFQYAPENESLDENYSDDSSEEEINNWLKNNIQNYDSSKMCK